MATPFRAYAEVCEALRATPSRLGKVRLAAQFLQGLTPEERAAGARFLAAKALPETSARGLDVGWSTMRAALGGAAQRTLLDDPLTVRAVDAELRAMSAEQGKDARGKRERRLRALLGRADAEERAWLLALLHGELRTGASDGVVLEAIAKASGAEPASVRRAHLLRGDLGEVAAIALNEGPGALAAVQLRVFVPLRPMLAEVAADLAEGMRELGACAVEPKYDGARIAIHKRGGEVRVFSRRLTDVTASVPECVEEGLALRCDEAVVEGEAVACDAQGKPLPFQELMRRFRRVHGVAEERARIPLTTHLFDCLHVDGRTLLDEPAEARWRELARIAPPGSLAPRIRTADIAAAQRVLDGALAAGHEGVMLKDPRSSYSPGKRGAFWLKVKPAVTLDCTIIGVEWGSGKREGKLSNYHLAVRVPEGEEALLVQPASAPRGPVTVRPGWAMVGKTFKGLTDAELDAMTERLRGLAEADEGWGYRVRPEVVVETTYNEIQHSPQYMSGFALRFARITAVRDDKGPEDADTLGAVRKLYEAQLKGKVPT
ncbi:MAG: ATP-dependent DNA ligase [Halobacteriales archaeon]|nr:ATP-dependent DNA ligase [Halobacteriales archaeon]